MSISTLKDGRKKERKLKAADLLSSVVSETSVAGAVELLRANTAFNFPSGTSWVVLVLSTPSIGGLSKRHARDEAKGSIISLIESDIIQTVATTEMLDEEAVAFIPNETTLDRMSEFSLLTEAPYSWAALWTNAANELIVEVLGEATFEQAQQVLLGGITLQQAVGEPGWSLHSGVVAEGGDSIATPPVDVDDAPATDEVGADAGDPLFDDVPTDGGEDVDFDAPVFEDVVDVPGEVENWDGVTDEAAFSDGSFTDAAQADPIFDDADDVDEASAAPEVPEVPEGTFAETQEEVRSQVARRFLNGDLDLEISLEEFNTSFAVGAPVVQIAVPEGSSEWLGDQISHLSRLANTSLAQLRGVHEDQLRTMYTTLMSKHVEQVINDVSPHREGSRYKQLNDRAREIHASQVAGKSELISKGKASLAEKFNEDAKQVGEHARLQAELGFKERNRTKMEHAQADIAAEIDRTVEANRTHAEREIRNIRQSDAQLRMQLGQNRIFEILQEHQEANLVAERGLLEQWKVEITALIEDNRQSDVARSNALLEQQSRENEVDELAQAHQRHIDSVRAENEARVREFEDKLDSTRRAAILELDAREVKWRHDLELEERNTQAATSRIGELIQQAQDTRENVRKEYEGQITDLRASRDSYAEQMVLSDKEFSRSGRIVTILMIALALLGTAAGFIFGVAFAG